MHLRLAHLTCSENVRPQDSEVVQGRVGNESHVTEVASISWPLYRNRTVHYSYDIDVWFIVYLLSRCQGYKGVIKVIYSTLSSVFYTVAYTQATRFHACACIIISKNTRSYSIIAYQYLLASNIDQYVRTYL